MRPNDVVYRELFILKVECTKIIRTINELRKGLLLDPRFAKLALMKGAPQSELFENPNPTGPQAPSDPFEVPLGSSD